VTRDKFAALMERRGIAYDEDEVFDAPIRKLLSRENANPKTAKGLGHGYATAILHLSPSTRSGLQTCVKATKGCRAVCLNEAGKGGIYKRGETDNPVQKARRRRTHWYFTRRDEFMQRLDREIALHVKRASNKGQVPCVRLNGTSDIRWETVKDADGLTVFDRHPNVTFYDYTKIPDRDVKDIPNYSLTFSLAESNDSDATEALANGINVAAVFHKLPTKFLGRRVVDGDETDLRFLDPKRVVVGLKAKGPAKQDKSGFVR
jgi:hypothetical protein